MSKNMITPSVEVLDEAGGAVNSKQSMSKDSINLSMTFMAQRILRVVVVMCIPNFFWLDTIVRKHRTKTLIHISERGKYKAFTGKAIEIIARDGQASKQINGIKVPEGTWWQGWFSKQFPKTIDKEKYERHKLKNVSAILKSMQTDMESNKMFGLTATAKEIGVSKGVLLRMAERNEIFAKQIGSKWYVDGETRDKLLEGRK